MPANKLKTLLEENFLMQIKKIASTLFLSMCLSLIGVSAWFLSTPIKVSAEDFASITIICGGGGSVTCSGSSCAGSDSIGCSCMNANGTTDKKSCPKSEELE